MLIKNAKLVLENKAIDGYLEIENKHIKKIGVGEAPNTKEVIDANGMYVAPGFIECHVHGGYGDDFESGDIKAYQNFAKHVTSEGVTRFCLASVTNSVEDNDHYFTEFGKFMKDYNHGIQAICLGAYMEGPFISPEKKGAHDFALLKKPDIALTDRWNKLANNTLRFVVYAPEEQDGSYTKWLVENNIIPTAGHSNVLDADFERDYLDGVRHVTHLFNAMSGVDHRNPGLAVFALNNPTILAEVVSDGVHLHEDILKLIYDHKTANGICIITDAMKAKGLPDGDYKLGDLPVIKTGIKVVLKNGGNLAASAATYDHNVRTYQRVCQIPIVELTKMTSSNIAKQMGIFDQTGSITEGKFADLVILDQDLNVIKTIVEGQVVFEK